MLNVFTLANGRLFQEEIESLEALANEYESRLPNRGEGFMLQPQAADRERRESRRR